MYQIKVLDTGEFIKEVESYEIAIDFVQRYNDSVEWKPEEIVFCSRSHNFINLIK